MVHVHQFLGDGVGAVSTVDGDGSALIGLQEVQFVVDAGECATGDLRGHIVGEHLLGPYILKPLQGYKVTKPQVGCLVGNQFQTGCFLLLRGVLL